MIVSLLIFFITYIVNITIVITINDTRMYKIFKKLKKEDRYAKTNIQSISIFIRFKKIFISFINLLDR